MAVRDESGHGKLSGQKVSNVIVPGSLKPTGLHWQVAWEAITPMQKWARARVGGLFFVVSESWSFIAPGEVLSS